MPAGQNRLRTCGARGDRLCARARPSGAFLAGDGFGRRGEKSGTCAMPIYSVSHVTTYRYRQPVGLGEHRMMLRPRDSHDQRLVEAELTITPKPASLRWSEDAFGNSI